uniref:Uncharacterized protein n=1 Tax=Pinctada fucata TaxID=50426 RepID=A0A194AM54_PINFU
MENKPRNNVFKLIFSILLFHSVVYAKERERGAHKDSWTAQTDDEDFSLDGGGSGSGCGEYDAEQIICDCSILEKYSLCMRRQCSDALCRSLYGECLNAYSRQHCPEDTTINAEGQADAKIDNPQVMNVSGYIWISIGAGIFFIGAGTLALLGFLFTRRRSTKDEIPKEKPKEDAKKDAEEDARYTDLGGKVFDYEEPVAKFNNGPPLKQNNQEKHFNNGLYGAKPAVVNVTENPYEFVHQPDPKHVNPSDV